MDDKMRLVGKDGKFLKRPSSKQQLQSSTNTNTPAAAVHSAAGDTSKVWGDEDPNGNVWDQVRKISTFNLQYVEIWLSLCIVDIKFHFEWRIGKPLSSYFLSTYSTSYSSTSIARSYNADIYPSPPPSMDQIANDERVEEERKAALTNDDLISLWGQVSISLSLTLNRLISLHCWCLV